MARNFFTQTPTAEIALAAATRTAIGRINAPATQIVVVTNLDLFFKGIVVTGTPVFVEVLRVTTDGTGMAARNPLQTVPKATALQTTGAVGPVSGANLPTAGDVLRTKLIHPQTGILYPFPLGQQIEIPGGGRLAVFLTAPEATSGTYVLSGEE